MYSEEFTRNFFKRIVGEDRKYKLFHQKMYVSLGNNRVAYIELGFPKDRKIYGWDSVYINVFDKTHGRIDSIGIDFEKICRGTKFERASEDYFINCNGNAWYVEPPEDVYNLFHNEIESYLEIFEEDF